MNIRDLVRESHNLATDKGWNDEGPRPVPELLCLIHSEVSEALEEFRNGHGPRDWRLEGPNGKPEGIPIELADVVIRIADMCGQYGIDLQEAIRLKMQYNYTRPHRHGGKKI